MYKYTKINGFPESLFYMERMVGYEQDPILLIEVEREMGQSNTVRTSFRTVVKCVSPFDHARTIRKKVAVSLITVLDSGMNEVSERCYSNQSDSYRQLPFWLKEEIVAVLSEQMDEVIQVLKNGGLTEWLSSGKRDGEAIGQ